MAKVLTQIQGKRALKQVLSTPSSSLSKFNVEPFRVSSFGIGAELVYQNEAGLSRLSSLYSAISPVVSGASLAQPSFNWSLRYLNYLAKTYPWRVSLVLTTTKAMLADIIAQKLIERKERLDYQRTGLFFAFGAVYSGCICHGLYTYIYPTLFSSRIRQLNAMGSVFFENLINTPFIFFPTFYIMKECLIEKSGSLKMAFDKYLSEVSEATVASWKLWFPAHCITFGILPVHLRIPFASVVSFFYYTLVSVQQALFDARRKEGNVNVERLLEI